MSNTKATPVQKHVTDFVLMTIGTLIMVVGIYFFKYTNNFSTGGVSGISVILGHYFPSTPGTFGLIINVILLLCGYIVLGKSFGIYTTYVTLLQSGLIWVLERVLPMSAPMTNQPFLELIEQFQPDVVLFMGTPRDFPKMYYDYINVPVQ